MITIKFSNYKFCTTSTSEADAFVKFYQKYFEVTTHVDTSYKGPEVNQIVVA